MHKARRIVCIIALTVLGCSSLLAQTEDESNRPARKLGFVTGYGNQTALDVYYDYQIAFIQFEYIKTIVQKKRWSLEMTIQPQINITSFEQSELNSQRKSGFEVGLNNGFVIRKKNQTDNLDLYFVISSGPLYVPNTPARQSDGLNFSSSLNLGVLFRLSDKVHIDFRPGVRHLSNAALRKPNRGINNVYIVSGLSFTL